MHRLYRVKTVITVMLTVTSGPKNSRNKWLLIILLVHDDKWWCYNDIQVVLFDSNIWSCGLIWELKHNLILIMIKSWLTKMLNAVNRVYLLSLINPHIMLVEYEMYSCLFIFFIGWKFRMGNRWQLVWGFLIWLLGLSQPVDRPCVEATTSESYLFNFYLCCKDYVLY
jgi:hypothetical protein